MGINSLASRSFPSRRFVLWLVLAVAPCWLFVAPAQATTYEVSPTGNDSNTGLPGAPWRTTQKAANT
ncbi:MAG: hypothetical protein M3347_15160, partial [Armatimonadota bacterium]|nr:hypothetical protein [Armatimonadota bacterium]